MLAALMSSGVTEGLGVPHRAAGLARGRAQPVREPGPVRGRHGAGHAGLRSRARAGPADPGGGPGHALLRGPGPLPVHPGPARMGRSRTSPPLVAGVGGSPVPAALVEDWGRRGVTLRSIYGISEAGRVRDDNPARRGRRATGRRRPAGVAPPVPGDRPAAGTAPPGQPGELQIAGASVTPGYWRRPEETAQAVTDGWLRTGDVAVIGQRPGPDHRPDQGHVHQRRRERVPRRDRGRALPPSRRGRGRGRGRAGRAVGRDRGCLAGARLGQRRAEPTSSAPGPRPGWPRSRSPVTSMSSQSCPATPPARSSRPTSAAAAPARPRTGRRLATDPAKRAGRAEFRAGILAAAVLAPLSR